MTNIIHRKNLAPNLIRQRLILEANTSLFINDPQKIATFLKELSRITDMTIMREPIVYTAHEDGWGAWQHWKTSWASFYTYPARNGDQPLVTLDCYTCKRFDIEKVVKFTQSFFKTTEIVWREIEV
jgi:S-adenosylmethionine/arginine decarboxylase-like enzyme